MTETIFQQLGLPSSMVTWLFIGIGVYMAGMLAIGFLSAKKVNNLKDYIVAGRRLPLWMATGTLLATWFGAGSSMGVAATVYQQGIIGVLADPFGASISLLLAGIFVVGILRRNKCLTVTDTIARKYGPGAGIYASLWMIPVYVGWLSAQFLGLGTILHVLTGLSVWKGTIIGAIVVLIYTYAGGMWAVTLTDIVQVSIIILGLMVIMPGAVTECGGLAALRSQLSDADVSLIPASFSGAGDVTYYIGSWIIMGLGCMVGQDLVQRSLASRSPNVAISSSVISGFMYMAVGIIPITIGFAARIVFAKYGFTAAEIGADIDNQVLPRMAIIVLGKASPVLLVMFIAALVSAIMSSADSSLLAGTSLLVNNVVCAFAGKENGKNRINGKAKLMLTRITTVVLSIISVVLALASSKIYTLMTSTWASQLVVVFIPVIASLYIPKSSRSCIWATMSVSTMVWLVYCGVACCGCGMPFLDLIDSELFTRSLTCGAVYGFLAGIVTFVMVYCGERITFRLAANSPAPGRKNNRRSKNKNAKAPEVDEQPGEDEIIEEIMSK